ncbi:MAG TPA: type VI secretion system membrane subunit TssM, partial [Blastocatellia bacterium]|nr:type VI secretion system membrane subunit TssM [Blastocatellia bacterium]
MSRQWDMLRSYLGLSALVSIYGIASLLVLYLGPQMGFSLTYQIVIIVLILLTWPFAILLAYLFRRRRRKKEAKSLESAGPSATSSGAPEVVTQEFSRSTEETVRWLKSTKLGAERSREVIYGLPWFLVTGPPESGKTSFLLSGGLDFHSLPGQRRSDRNVVRPTRGLDYRVTDSAVFLDTAGRYQTEDEYGDEWESLIGTIKKYRTNRPLDGLVIAVSGRRLLESTDSEIDHQAKVLRERLDQVIAGAGAKFPVYLVFTNMDALEGFADFFGRFDRGDRAQVWGATIPLEQMANAHALFDIEFDYLCDALMQRRLLRLSAPAEPLEQRLVFNFPLHFIQARNKFGLFTSALFRPNPFSENPLLRGFYFSSAQAPAKGSAKLLEVSSSGNGKGDGTGGALVRVEQDGYFTNCLIGDVLMRDKDLAASFQAGERRHPHRLRNSALAVAAGLLFVFTVGMFVSFGMNKVLIAEAADLGGNVAEIAQRDNGSDPASKGSAESRTELEAVDSLRSLLAKLDDYDKNSPPLYLRFGLYSGNAMNGRLREIYFDSINQRFFKHSLEGMEQDIQAFVNQSSGGPSSTHAVTQSEDELGRYYDLLKAYLMTSTYSDKSEWSFLEKQLARYWMKNAPGELENLARQQLEFCAKEESDLRAPHWPVNDDLVSRARTRLEAYPAIDRYFKSVTSEVNEKVQPVTLDSIVHPQERGWLSGSPSVPGSFTLEGYRGYMIKAFDSAAGEMSKDDWVMGTTTHENSTDLTRLQQKYFSEYVAEWRQFLHDTSVSKLNTKDDVREALKVMSGSNSPVVLVVIRSATETDFGRATRGGGFFGWIKGLFSGSRADKGGATAIVEREFGPLIQFVTPDGEKGEAAVVQYRNELQSLRDQLDAGSGDQLAQTSKALLTNKEEPAFQKAEQDIGRLLESLNTPASKDAAALLKQPLRNIRAMQTAGTFDQISETWRNQLYPKAKALESGYPFTDGGEASVEDLARFLNPVDGELWAFFNANLATAFEDVQGRWKLRESGAFDFSPEFVDYLNSARQLRDALFA